MSETNPYEASESQIVDLSSDFESVAVFSATQRIGRIRWLAYNSALMFGMYFLIFVVALLVYGTVGFNPESDTPPVLLFVLLAVLYLFVLVLSVIIGVRRLHDLNQSGWWFALFILPLINLGLFVYLLFFPGSPSENNYGKKPEPNSILTWIVGLSLPILMLLGIIAAIALPAYQDYSTRAKGVEALYLADQIKPAIEQIYREEGSFENAKNGYKDIPAEISGDSTAYIKVSDGIILAELSLDAEPQLAGKQFIIEPIVSDDYIIWQCTFTGEPEFVPPSCR